MCYHWGTSTNKRDTALSCGPSIALEKTDTATSNSTYLTFLFLLCALSQWISWWCHSDVKLETLVHHLSSSSMSHQPISPTCSTSLPPLRYTTLYLNTAPPLVQGTVTSYLDYCNSLLTSLQSPPTSFSIPFLFTLKPASFLSSTERAR